MSYIQERRQEERSRRREQIITAAEAMYLELGWDDVTIDAVARRARLSRALVYVYFKDKRDLHFAIVLRALDVLRERFQSAMDQVRTGLEKIEAIGRAYLIFAQEYPHYFDACARLEAQASPPAASSSMAASPTTAQHSSASPAAFPAVQALAPQAQPRKLPPLTAAALPLGTTSPCPASIEVAPVSSMFEASQPMLQIVITALTDGQRDGTIRRNIGDLTLTSHVLWGFTHGTIQIAITKAAQLAEAGISSSQLIEHARTLVLQMLANTENPVLVDGHAAESSRGTSA